MEYGRETPQKSPLLFLDFEKLPAGILLASLKYFFKIAFLNHTKSG
jgi:hypothetical protein